MKTFHFIGLGGIGMSALARVLLQRGEKVQGSDLSLSPLLQELEKEGARIQVGQNGEALAESHTIIYSSAVKEDNLELIKAKSLQLPLLHRSDLLDLLMQGQKPLLVTGTHGKTTTSALLSSVLLEARQDPSFVIGGILKGEKTNGRAGQGPYFVAEADESDGSFLKTAPFGAIVTNLENDHLDYWETEERLDHAFAQFFSHVKAPQHLFWCYDDRRLRQLNPPGISYGFGEGAEVRLCRFETKEEGIVFDLTYQGRLFSSIALSLFGRHNALNGAAVFALALSLGIDEEAIRRAFARFSGTARRLEFKGEAHRVAIYDDYGHHPTEIAATLKALREKVGERRIVAVFQPHRFTRVRDLFDGFLTCFSDADEVILTDIYGAGEAPIQGITSAALYTKMKEKLGPKLSFFPRQHLETGVADHLSPFDVVLTIGAGDITHAALPILQKYEARAPRYRVAVLAGGTSAEHAVSLMSVRNIAKALDSTLYDPVFFGVTKEGHWIMGSDAFEKLEKGIRLHLGGSKIPPEVFQELSRCQIAIPVFHGPQGEDGMIQGLLETMGIPYVGCDYRSAAHCMQKGWTKHTALLHHIPTAPFVEIDLPTHRKDPHLLAQLIEESLSYPVWVKPVHLGSSIGVSRVASSEELDRAVHLAFLYDDVLIAEKEVEGRQIEFAVLGNEKIQIGRPAEILNHGAFYDYEKKYGAEASKVEIPASLSQTELAIGLELAERAYRASGCKGMARVDFFFDTQGFFWLNEINPFPGFTSTSGYPKMWEAAGWSQSKLLDELIVLALHKARSAPRGPGSSGGLGGPA